MDDKAAVERLSLRYAQACDRRDGATFDDIFVEDALIEGGGFRMEGRAAISRGITEGLGSRYLVTRHQVHNILVDVTGETATGETYGTAHHISNTPEGVSLDYIMTMTYRDTHVKRGGRWFFKERKFTVHWTETRVVTPGPA